MGAISNRDMYQVLDRISVDGHLATVKYVGTLPIWGPNVQAYGVEWDESTRGKNSGSLDGIIYFDTSVAGAGSFLKTANRRIMPQFSFTEALHTHYAGQENVLILEESIQFGKKTVENYGFQKLNALLRNFEKLKVLSLDKKQISSAGDVPFLRNVEALDLSYNLFSSFSEVFKIVERMPTLQSLNLNGNRFAVEDLNASFPSVSELTLASTMISPAQLLSLLPCFPSLKVLSLAGNKLHSDELPDLLNFERLDLSFNLLETVPQLNATALIVADNNIAQIPKTVLPGVQTLDLRCTNIESWNEIDKINHAFPNLKELRIDGLPLFGDITVEEMTVNIIARIECLDYRNQDHLWKLNGSTILEDEIKNSELYFVAKVRSGQLQYSNADRWKTLLAKYDIGDAIAQSQTVDSSIIQLSIRLSSEPELVLFTRKYLAKNTVLRLKGTISRFLKRPLPEFEVYYYVNEDNSSYNATRQSLHDDIASLENLALASNQRIYISL